MKHTTSRMLFAYWDHLRGERAAPERSSLQPGDMRHVLSDAFVLGRADGVGMVFRLAGTRCSALFGRELRDRTLVSLWGAADTGGPQRLVDTVAHDTVGLVAGLIATSEHGARLSLELLLLPLRHRGRSDSRMLGAISPAIVPNWAGTVPILSLDTQVVRVIGTGQPAPVERDPARRRRNLFVVHQGGLA